MTKVSNFCNVTHLLRLTLLDISIRGGKFFKLIGESARCACRRIDTYSIQAATAPLASVSSGLTIRFITFIIYNRIVKLRHNPVQQQQHRQVGDAQHKELYPKRENAFEPPARKIAEKQQPQRSLYADTQRTPLVSAESLIPYTPECKREAAHIT